MSQELIDPATLDLQLKYLIFLVSVFGFFGGVVSALHENYGSKSNAPPHEKCRKCESSYILGRGLIGIAGALGAVFLALGIGKIDIANTVLNELFIVTLSTVAGTISFKLLPIIGNKLQKQIDAVEDRVEQNESKIETESLKVLEYSSAISAAEISLTRDQIIDMPLAIKRLEDLQSTFPNDRTLHVFLGRLYRNVGDLDKAILTLRKFIRTLEGPLPGKFPSSRLAIDKADAYFNIACYHALKLGLATEHGYSQSERDRLKEETLDALKESVTSWEPNRKHAIEDGDFDVLREDTDFMQLVGNAE